MGDQSIPSDKTDRVEEIASRFHDLLKAGAAPFREAMVAAYPALAPELDERLAEIEKDLGKEGRDLGTSLPTSTSVGVTGEETLETPTTPADPRIRLSPD